MGVLEFLSLRDDFDSPPMSLKLSRLLVSMVALSVMPQPWRVDISTGDYIYYWPGCFDGWHACKVIVTVSD